MIGLSTLALRIRILPILLGAMVCTSLAMGQEPAVRPRTAQPAPAALQQPPQPRMPFQLSADEQIRLDKLLQAWEKQSDTVKSFKCKFTRWDYDTTFGPKNNDYLMAERHGEIKFRAPDNGTFKETEMKVYVPPKNPEDPKDRGRYEISKDQLDHWVCDGKSIYQFKTQQKVLEVTELPPDMRGKAITEGPLPFIFGAKAQTLNMRYWMRDKTPPEEKGKAIWLEAWPKFAQQAGDFQHVEVILTHDEMMPVAMQVFTPNGRDRTAYLFENRVVNSIFDRMDFIGPQTPFGWNRVDNKYTPPTAAEVPPPRSAKQAARPKASAPVRR
jgi:TIGR03009 family protein